MQQVVMDVSDGSVGLSYWWWLVRAVVALVVLVKVGSGAGGRWCGWFCLVQVDGVGIGSGCEGLWWPIVLRIVADNGC